MERWIKTSLNKKSSAWLARKLVPNTKYNDIYNKYKLFGLNYKKKLVDHMYESKANHLLNMETFDYIPMPESMQSLMNNLKYKSKKEMNIDRMNKNRANNKALPGTTPKYAPSTPFNMKLKTGKGPLIPLTGNGIIPLKYIEIYRFFIQELQTEVEKNISLRFCKCDPPRLGAWNGNTIAMTEIVQICCDCGMQYGSFAFGEKIPIDGKQYYENAMRFAHLTSRVKDRYALAEKIQLIYGIKAPDIRTYNKYKHVVIDKTTEISEESMAEVVANEIEAKQRLGRKTTAGGDASWNQRGYKSKSGQFNLTVRTDDIDPVTGTNWKVAAVNVRRIGVNHFGSSGSMEEEGMDHCVRELHSKGLVTEELTKDCDSASRAKLRTINEELGLDIQKRNDMNHTTNAIMTKALTSDNKANGYKLYKLNKNQDDNYTHAIHKQLVGGIHSRLTGMLQKRKELIQSGECELNAEFRDDLRLEVDGILLHILWGTRGHPKCKANKHAKSWCQNISDPDHVTHQLKNSKGEYMTYPCNKKMYEWVRNHFGKIFTDQGIDDLLLAFHTNANESFNGLLASMCDKSKFISLKKYCGYVHTTVAMTNIGEKALTLEEDKRLGLETNKNQIEMCDKRAKKRKNQQSRQRTDNFKRRRVSKRYHKTDNDKSYDSGKHVFD